MTGYRQVLNVPKMPLLLGLSLLARAAITADIAALTMYVVLGLRLSYGAAGGVAASMTAGIALGAPMLGRMIDRRGLRIVLLVTSTAQVAFWLAAPTMPIGLLFGAALAAGLTVVPVQLVTRQAISAMTPPHQRRPAFALESVQGELSYVIGPPIVILCAVSASPTLAAWAVGAAVAAGGIGIALLDPPLRTDPSSVREQADRPGPRPRLGRDIGAVLVMAFGTTVLLGGTDLAVIAALRAEGQTTWAAVVVAVYGGASIAGGLAYGAARKSLPTPLLLGALGMATLPAALAHDWRWLCLAGLGAGLLTAPTLSAISEAVSLLAPVERRGVVIGLQSSALAAGFALGSPLVGATIDLTTPSAGFAAAGLAGGLAALTGYGLLRRGPAPPPAATDAEPVPQHDVVGAAWAEQRRIDPCLTE